METEIKNMEHPPECECPKCLRVESDAFVYNHFYEMI